MVFLPLFFLIGLGVGFLIWSPRQQAEQTTGQTRRYAIPIDQGDSVLGPADAPVTLVMFSDYECPYCKIWYQQVFPKVMQDYPGQIRFAYKDFPLYGSHQNAAPAAEAADCAGEQGKYWEYQDRLFNGGLPLSDATFTQYAREVGLDETRFAGCTSTHQYEAEVKGDYEFAANLGVQSTPTFFINGIPLVGAQPYESFKQVIDQELSGKKS